MRAGARALVVAFVCALALSVAAPARAVTFTSATPIAINDATASTPYPSAISVSGVVGTVTAVTATLHGFHHTCAHDVDMLLVGPRGQDTILMSDAGDCGTSTQQPPAVDLTFADGAPYLPCFVGPAQFVASGTYGPTNDPTFPQDCSSGATPDVFAAPAPAGPYPVGLGTFNGVDPNGRWSLYTMDSRNDDSGAVDHGWSLDFAIPAGTLASAPQIKGKPDVGRTLTAVSGATGNGAAPAYRWNRCNARGHGCRPIASARKSAYRPKSADRGHTLTVTETAVTSGGASAPLGSKRTAVVGPALLSAAGTRSAQNALSRHGLLVSVRSNLAGRLAASATVRVPGRAAAVRFKSVTKKLRAGRRTRIRLGLSASARQWVAAALGQGAKLRARLRLVVTDVRGARSTKRVTVRLKP